MQDPGSVVGIVAPDCADIVHVLDIGDHREPRHGSGMAVPSGLCELTSRYPLAPVRWFEVVEVALGDGYIVVVVLQLGFPVVVKQPVKQLLVIGPRTESVLDPVFSEHCATYLSCLSFSRSVVSE